MWPRRQVQTTVATAQAWQPPATGDCMKAEITPLSPLLLWRVCHSPASNPFGIFRNWKLPDFSQHSHTRGGHRAVLLLSVLLWIAWGTWWVLSTGKGQAALTPGAQAPASAVSSPGESVHSRFEIHRHGATEKCSNNKSRRIHKIHG